MSACRRFLKVFAGFSSTCFIAVFAINALLDPYGLRTSGGRINHARLVKAIHVNRLDPEFVLIGSSSVAIALSPSHKAFESYESVYNLGMLGVNFYETAHYFQHAASSSNLERALIGLDFYAFNEFRDNKPGFSEARLNSRQMPPQDFLRLYLSLEALTLVTEAHDSGKFFAPDGTIEEMGNFRANSREELFSKHLLQNFSLEEDMYGRYALSMEALEDFSELVSMAQQKDVDTQIFLPPSHATLFYASVMSDYWETYQQWLRTVVQFHPVWDFSGCNSITTQPINSSEQYYDDPLHFTPKVGNWILNRIYDIELDSLPSDFGVYVTSENVDAHLEKVHEQCDLWERRNPGIMEWLDSLNLKQELVPPTPADSNI